MNTRLLGVSLALTLAALAAGCSNNGYDYARVSSPGGDPASVVDFSSGIISVPEGSVASAHVDLISHSNNVLTGSNIQSANPSVLQIAIAANDSSGYVFLGMSPGSAEVQLTVNGQVVQTITATVSAPPASSVPPTVDAGVTSVNPPDAGGPDAPADSGAPDGDAASASD
jgi:hypothetical protein